MLPGISTFPFSQSAGAAGLLDDYPSADFGLALWKLRSAYSGNCIRVRRASDSAELDIGFAGSGAIDASAIATHCGGSDGFVTTWYDQSGTTNDFSNSTSAQQPKIYDGSSGSMLVDGNGNVAMYVDGGDVFRSANVNNINGGATFTLMIAIQGPTTVSTHLVGSGYDGNSFIETHGDGLALTNSDGHAMLKAQGNNVGYKIEGAVNLTSSTDTWIIVGKAAPSDSELWVNGTSVATNTTHSPPGIAAYDTFISLFAGVGNNAAAFANRYQGYCSCAAGWISDQGPNAVGIYNNVAANIS